MTPEEKAQLIAEQQRKFAVEHKELEETARKKRALEKAKVENAFQEMERNEKTIRTYKAPDFLSDTENEMEDIEAEHRDFLMGLQKRMVFIDDRIPEFNEVIPFCAKQLILMGAVSGQGKSTALANIVYGMISRRLKPLIISNEESAQDIFPKVYGLFKGMHYRPDKLSLSETEEFLKATRSMYPLFKVIDNNYKGLDDPASSLEGLISVLEGFYNSQYKADAILIDYYQCFHKSLRAPQKNMYQVLPEITEVLEKYRKKLDVPIVVFAQIKADSEALFKERIEGSKSIFNRATCAIEIISHNSELKTEWVVQKNRFNGESVNKKFFTGWWKGRYIPYDQQHVDKVTQRKLDNINHKERRDDGTGKTGTSDAEQGNTGESNGVS